MSAALLGLGTATPEHRMSQDDALRMFSDIVCDQERQKRLGRALFKNSLVQNRFTCVPHQVAYNWCQPINSNGEPTSVDLAVPSAVIPDVCGGESPGPTTKERMELYSQLASGLAIESCEQALQTSKLQNDEITHLITVSCTGFEAPGVDLELINRLGLPASTQRINVGFMGCHGAINGLRAALGVVSADSSARVLLCAVELCSLHYRFQWDSEGIIGNALFADGAAALVLGQESNKSNIQSDWRLIDTGSIVIPDSLDAMSWRVGDYGFEMRLTAEVGDKIEEHLSDWLKSWLAKHHLKLSDIDHWGVHPGGPRILDAVESSLGLGSTALATSHAILESYGNMSSPTVVFILNEFFSQHSKSNQDKQKHCILLGFGPGLVAEVALLVA